MWYVVYSMQLRPAQAAAAYSCLAAQDDYSILLLIDLQEMVEMKSGKAPQYTIMKNSCMR